MKTIAVSVALAPVLFFSLFSITNAQTAANLQAELAALLAQLAALQGQLQNTGSPSLTPASTGSYGTCPSLTRTLRQGMSGSDVSALQAFLAGDAQIYPERTVSGYFGGLTQLAVQRFQARHGVVNSGTPDSTGYGLVGRGTRAAILAICASGQGNPGLGSCSMGGLTVANGQTANFYSVSTVQPGTSCDSYRQTRQCVNGSFSGSTNFQYGSCTTAGSTIGGSCTYNGVVMANGQSLPFYRLDTPPYGQECQSATRTCVNGVVTGSRDYGYPTCAPATSPVSCTLDGVAMAHGQSLKFYKQETVLFGQSCASFQGTRTCDNGYVEGDRDYRFTSCSAAGAKSCTVVTAIGSTISTTTVAHGSSRNFWSDNSVPYTTNCDAYKLSRTCTDGVLSGSASHKYPSCDVVEEKSCVIDGITVAGGATRTFYSARSVAATAKCDTIDASRKCTNGVLSGSATYQYAYCAPIGKRYCVLDGAYVADDASKSFYSTKKPAFGSTCSQFDETRTCNDGTLGGTASFAFATCTEPTGASCTVDGQTVAHGSSHTFYSSRTGSSDVSCSEQALSRTCNDGVLTGSAGYKYKACSNSTSLIENTSQVAAALSAMEALLQEALAKLNSWF